MNTTQGTLCLATTAILLLTACGADDDDAEPAGTTSEPTAAAESSAEQTQDGGETESAESEAFASAEVSDVAGNPIGTVTAAEAENGVRLSAEVQNLTPGFRAVAVHEHGVCEAQSADQWGQIGDFNSAGAVVPGPLEEDPGVVQGEEELAESPGAETPDQHAPGQQTPEEQGTDEQGTDEQGTEGQAPGGQQDQLPGSTQQQAPPQGSAGSNAATAQFSVRPAGALPGSGAAGEAEPGQTDRPPEAAEDLPRSQRAGALPNLMVNENNTGYLEVVSTGLTEDLLMDDDGTAVVIYADADHHGNVPERYAPYGPDAGSLATGDAGPRQACGVLEAAD